MNNKFHGPLANEETNLFNRRATWCPEDTVDEKYLEYLMPHSKAYFSRLRPLFSFEIKSLESLNQFSHVLFRDGLIFLLRFFQRFPDPGALKTKVAIHKKLSWVIPDSWKDRVILYEVVHHQDSNVLGKPASERRELNILVDLHDKTWELKKLTKNFEKINIIPFFNILRGEDFLNYERKEEFERLEKLKKSLGQPVEVISLNDALAQSLEKTYFVNLAEWGTFYSDSSLSHRFLSLGAKGLYYGDGTGELISQSPYHSFQLEEFDINQCDQVRRSLLYNELNFPKGRGFSSMPPLERGVEDYFKVHYYSHDLVSLCRRILNEA